MKNDFLIVHKSIVPDNFMAVIKARKLIEEQNVSVSNACIEVGISRGTYYKYKDYVFLPSQDFGKKAILSFMLDNQKGVLSNLLNFIANSGGNILAINQETPIHGSAFVTITLDVLEMIENVDDVLEKIKLLKGIKNAKLVAIES